MIPDGAQPGSLERLGSGAGQAALHVDRGLEAVIVAHRIERQFNGVSEPVVQGFPVEIGLQLVRHGDARDAQINQLPIADLDVRFRCDREMKREIRVPGLPGAAGPRPHGRLDDIGLLLLDGKPAGLVWLDAAPANSLQAPAARVLVNSELDLFRRLRIEADRGHPARRRLPGEPHAVICRINRGAQGGDGNVCPGQHLR